MFNIKRYTVRNIYFEYKGKEVSLITDIKECALPVYQRVRP